MTHRGGGGGGDDGGGGDHRGGGNGCGDVIGGFANVFLRSVTTSTIAVIL